jgi:hypothetical protein
MRVRKGWRIIWPDGTEWDGDCAKWAREPVMPGARVIPIRIMGSGSSACPGCATGSH